MRAFTPGYPVDLRTPDQQQRAFKSEPGDFELAAARVIACLTGACVVLQDDNSAQGMADIRIEYPTGIVAFAEVVQDLDTNYAAMSSEVRKREYRITPRATDRIWWATLTRSARLRSLEKQLPNRLAELQAVGEVFESGTRFEQHLDKHPNAVVRELAAIGVTHLSSRPTVGDEEAQILINPIGTGGQVGLDWNAFDDYIAAHLSGPTCTDVRRKLMATDAAERHVFVGITFTTPWPVYHALSEDYRELPPCAPQLPDEITHLWVWSSLERCLVWFPSEGWFDPRGRWATA